MNQIWLCGIIAALSTFRAEAADAEGSRPCEREMIRSAQLHGIPLGILYAVGLTETGRRGILHPYAIGAKGTTVFAGSLRQAMESFEAMRRQDVTLIDLGCMQINYHYHADRFPSVQAMFDPARNVDYAARFLKEL